MDFSFTSDQQDLRELAAKILGDATTLERVKTVAAADDGFDRELWSALADAGIIGISLPESAAGVSVEREDTMLGAPMVRLVLRDAEATKLAGPEGLTWLLQRAQTAMAVTMSGAAATALDLTSTYVKERKQFGRAIGTFQAVS